MVMNRYVINRIIKNAAIAMGLNLIGMWPHVCGIYYSVKCNYPILLFLLLVCVFNVLLLGATGAVMATRELRRGKAKGLKIKQPLSRMQRLEQVICQRGLPGYVEDYIKLVVRKMGYRFKFRREVAGELCDHFVDALGECEDAVDKQQTAQRLIEEFGDVKLLGILLRRGKKRCRPMWQKVIAHSLQAAGLVVVLLCAYTVWFMMGSAVPSVDYLAVIDQAGHEGLTQADDAWPDYKKTRDLFVKPDKTIEALVEKRGLWGKSKKEFESVTDEEIVAVTKWVEQNEPTWRTFETGSLKAYCTTEFDFYNNDDEKWLAFCAYGHIDIFARYLTYIGLWRVRLKVEEAQIEEALDDCFVMLRISRNLHRGGFLVGHVLGIFIDHFVHKALLDIVAVRLLSAADLQKLGQRLNGIYPQGYPHISIDGERMVFLDTVQRIFTEGGPGGGHLIPGKLRAYCCLFDNSVGMAEKKHKGSMANYMAISMGHVGRDETIAKCNEVYDELKTKIKKSPYERHVHKVNDACSSLAKLPRQNYLLLFEELHTNHYTYKSDSRFNAKCLYEATITVLALKRWELEKGKYPVGLNELVEAGFLKEIPDDPYSNGALRYDRRGDDFVLYSVAGDFEDNNGAMSTPEDDPWGLNAKGDRVLWPVANDGR